MKTMCEYVFHTASGLDLYFLVFLSVIFLCLLRIVKFVFLLMTTLFVVCGMEWSSFPDIKSKNSLKANPVEKVELFGITIDCQLTFNGNLTGLCCNPDYRSYSLRKIRKYLTQD